MTITDNGRRTRDQMIEQARQEIGEGPLPSRTALSKMLKTHFTTASEIHDALSRERLRKETNRRKQSRRAAVEQGPPKRFGRMVLLHPTPPLVAPSEPTPETPVELISAVPLRLVPNVSADPVDIALDEPPAVEVEKTPLDDAKPVRTWPILIIAAGAFVAVWAGWVGLGGLTGFGLVNLLPGLVADGGWATIDTRITLPASMEAYSAYAFYILLHPAVNRRARRFAAWSSGGAVALGMLAQVAYHQMISIGMTSAPAWVTAVVSCIPVAVFGLGAALRHMVRAEEVKN